MRNKLLFFLMIVLSVQGILISCTAEPEWPEGLPHGELWLPNIADPDTPGGYFDFSEGEIVYGDAGKQRGDIFLENTFIAGNPALGVAIHDSMADSILYDKSAPGWGSGQWKTPPDAQTPARIPIYGGHNIWVRTAEGNTGKIKLLQLESNEDYSSYNRVKIQWIYQPDGSTEFHAVTEAGDTSEQAEN